MQAGYSARAETTAKARLLRLPWVQMTSATMYASCSNKGLHAAGIICQTAGRTHERPSVLLLYSSDNTAVVDVQLSRH